MAILIATVPSGATPQAATPTFSPAAGTYATARTVTISTTTVGAAIYYTINGGIPSTSSTLYTGPLNISSNSNIQAIAVLTGYLNSAVGSAAYSIGNAAAAPTFTPSAGTYSGAQSVVLASATTGASIYYTTDGSTPTITSTPYMSAITVSVSETIKAIAIATGYLNSSVASASYTITGGSANYLGVNLSGLSYYDSEMPFLNALKQTSGWGMVPSGLGQGDLQVDSDGYVTSMTTISGATLTSINAAVFVNIANGSAGLPPNQTGYYPPGPYRFQFTGKGTFYFYGYSGQPTDVTAISSSSPGVTVSGGQLVSTSTGVVNVTLTINSPSNTGFRFVITAIPDNVNYPRAMSFVQSTYASNYDAGEILHPLFKASMASYDRVRFMDLLSTNNQTQQLTFGALANGQSGNIYLHSVDGVSGQNYPQSGSISQDISTGIWTFTATSPALTAGQGVLITGTPPTGFTSGTTYFVLASNLSSTTCQLSATIGGSPIVPSVSSSSCAINAGSVWPYATGNYYITFANAQAQVVECACVCGSQVVTLSTALTSAVPYTNTYTNGAWYLINGPTPTGNSWSNRTLPSNFGWGSRQGAPYEVCFQLANELGVDPWIVFPMGCDSSHFTGMAALAKNGTGSGLASFTGVPSTATIYCEFSNEVWNGAFQQFHYVGIVGPALWPSSSVYQGQEFYGTQVAKMGQAFQAEYGSAYGTQVKTIMGMQTDGGNGYSFMNTAMNAPDWVAQGNPAPYTLVHGLCMFAYFTAANDGSNLSSADSANILSFPTQAAQLNEFFSLMYTNVGHTSSGGGYTYSSIASGGILAGMIGPLASVIAQIRASTYSYKNIPIHGYETGDSWNNYTGSQASFMTFLYAAHRDPRSQYIYYDPGNVMYGTYGYASANGQTGFLPAMINAGLVDFNHFNSVTTLTVSGCWGALESVMQPVSPLTSAPPKYQGLANWAAA
jgi:hypothetical protein